jgi:hypothetical protein
MDKLQKHDSSKCNTPLSEPFRTGLVYAHVGASQNIWSSARRHTRHLQVQKTYTYSKFIESFWTE